MSFDNNADNEPQPFIRQEGPSRKRGMQSQQPAPKAGTSGGVGCALVGLVIVLVAGLIGIALFLPPFSIGDRLFNTPYAPLSAQNASQSSGGLTVSVDPANPGSGFGVRIRPVAYDVFAGQKSAAPEDATWIKAARAALPPSLTPLSPVYVLDKQGTAPGFNLSVALPQGADPAQVDLYRYDMQSGRWQFVPAHASADNAALVADMKSVPERIAAFLSAPLVPIVGVTVDVGQDFKADVAAQANVVYPAGLQPTSSGALQGVLPAGVDLGKGYGVVPTIRNFSNPAAVDVATVTTLMQNSGLRSVHIERLVEFATRKAYGGLSIDYRHIPADQRDNFTAFITALASTLHNSNLTLTVVVPFPTQEGSTYNTSAYDWRAIGSAADSVQILLPLDPQAYVQNGTVSAVLKWATGEVNRARLQAALSVLSVQETEGSFVPVSYNDVLSPLGQITVKPTGIVAANSPVEASLSGYAAQFGTLEASNTPSIKYFAADGSIVGTMWLTNGAVLGQRLRQIAGYNVAGVVLYDLTASGVASDIVSTLATYKVNQLTPENSQPVALGLKWSVVTGNAVAVQATGQPGTPFVYKPQTDSIIKAEIVGAESQGTTQGTSQLGSASVHVATAVPVQPTPQAPTPEATTPPDAATPAATAQKTA